ncbi:DUF4031 domain-containing protein [Streptomyces sp. NBC_01511]|uniref:DUF4031 domain-containing protein n=1 Tax=Streptomyces sp. NBC_01511 TaxID=2903889 RepID=UPI00386D9B60
MTVYVDEIKDYTTVAKMRGLRYTHWCHLLADTEDELHEFAARLGLRRSWFQAHAYRWHYDIVPSKRAQAVRFGAQEVDRRFVAQLMNQRREQPADVPTAEQGTGPRCGNNPNARLTDGDRQVVEEVKAYLKQRKT